MLRYPDRTSITGQVINDYLLRKFEIAPNSASLLLAANLWEMQSQITNILTTTSKLLIMDRYVWSNIAYSVARGMDREVNAKINQGLPSPDLIIFLDADPEIASRRAEFGNERFDQVDFQRCVAASMHYLADTSSIPILKIDGSLPPKEIASLILDHIKPSLP